MKTPKMTLQKRLGLSGLLFMIPWLIGLAIFAAYPLFYSIWLSICYVEFSIDVIDTTPVGFKWYDEALTKNVNFIPGLIETLKFIGFLTPMILVVSVIFALLLNKALPGRGIFRALFFFPVVFINGPVMNKLINNKATAIITSAQYSVYQVIETLPKIISTPLLYIFDNFVMMLWFSGIQILIMITGLQKINASLYEAATIDGASKWQIFWKISLPCLRPMLLVAAVYTIVDLSEYSENPVTTYIQKCLTITEKPYSYSAAMSWIYSLAVLMLLLLSFLILKERRKKKVE